MPNAGGINAPGQLANIAEGVNMLSQLPSTFMGVLCILRLPGALMPEWFVKPHVENVSNRSFNPEKDIQDPNIPATNASTPEESTTIKLPPPSASLEKNTQNIASIQKTLKGIVPSNKSHEDLINTILYTQIESENIELVGLLENIQAHRNKFETQWAQYHAAQEKINNEIQYIAMTKPTNEFWAHPLVQVHVKGESPSKFLASGTNISIPQIPTIEPIEKELNTFREKTIAYATELEKSLNVEDKNTTRAYSKGIYLHEATADVSTRLVLHEPSGNTTIHISDLTNDGTPEILYSIDQELFIKYLDKPEPITPEYKSIQISYQDFQALFIGAYNTSFRSHKQDLNISFDKIEPETYLELTLTPRFDDIYAITYDPKFRGADTWHQYGYSVKEYPNIGDIQTPNGVITNVIGKPTIKQVQKVEITKYTKDECNNPEITKTTLNNRTKITSREPSTKLQIIAPELNTPQEVILNQQEQIWLSGGTSICVYQGNAFVEKNTTEVKIPNSGMILADEFSIHTGIGQSVNVSFFDGTQIYIAPNQRYTFETILSERNTLTLNKIPVQKNHYGFWRSVKNNISSHIESKIFLPTSSQ